MPVQAGESKVFATARADASALAAELGPRIPSLVVVVSGLPAGVEPVVSLNGVIIPAAAAGLPRKVNPGTHALEVTAVGFVSLKRDLEMQEKQVRTETFRLEPGPSALPTTSPSATTVVGVEQGAVGEQDAFAGAPGTAAARRVGDRGNQGTDAPSRHRCGRGWREGRDCRGWSERRFLTTISQRAGPWPRLSGEHLQRRVQRSSRDGVRLGGTGIGPLRRVRGVLARRTGRWDRGDCQGAGDGAEDGERERYPWRSGGVSTGA